MLRKKISIIVSFTIIAAVMMLCFSWSTQAQTVKFKLGNEMLMSQYHQLIEGKNIGLVTNQSGVTSQGVSMIDILAKDTSTNLVALYGPEHGIDGTAKAGEYVASYTHPKLGIPVYSLYGSTRMPSKEMLSGIDLLVFDIQDIGARSYTYMSTLNYCMMAAKQYGKTILVLDRPNPLGGEIVDGPVLEEPYKSFVGIDNLPMSHGMTAGELALYYNRNIGADLRVIPMEGYTRKMNYKDSGLSWVQTSPNIPDLDSVFGYGATGLGEGTGIFQADKFKWIGGKGIDSQAYADLLNQAGLQGVAFIPEQRNTAGGVRLKIQDYHTFNPAKTGIYALTLAHSLTNFTVPKSGQSVVMFDKIMGTNKIGQYLEQGLTPQQIEAKYAQALGNFKIERKKYLIYGSKPYQSNGREYAVIVKDKPVLFDSSPYIDANSRLMVPVRAITEAMGAEVRWDPKKQLVTIIREGKTVQLTINRTTAIVNGKASKMDTSPVIQNSRTMVPVRYVSEYFGAKVYWNPYSLAVFVD